ncbi:hypothetical protein PHMEG_00030568 [Phytophthora megakarya]|uniref:Core-binding (CB) domain-containing protein n=1 Tax=Phytophthora megakarya TaxID=4795 RepID=A0A225UYG8_9STRA|nr:hypothetical protein PHMEG_00030568 [Phytophthora megakarya]
MASVELDTTHHHRLSDKYQKAYQSCINGIKKWIEKNLQSPHSFLDENGGISVAVITKSPFIEFLLDKINSKSLKVSSLEGYRSAIWNIYREKEFSFRPSTKKI